MKRIKKNLSKKSKNFYDNNKEKVKEYKKNYKPKINPVNSRKRSLKSRYKITPEEYDEMLLVQNGCCAICGKHKSEFKKRLHVDHDHSNGKVRGLLCWGCNGGLGLFKDNLINIQNAANYLNNGNNGNT